MAAEASAVGSFTEQDVTSESRIIGFEGTSPTANSDWRRYLLSSLTHSVNIATFTGWDASGATDSSAAFTAAVTELGNAGGVITIPPCTAKWDNAPVHTATGKGIYYIGSGAQSSFATVNTTSASLFQSTTSGDINGGGVFDLNMNGDGQGGTGTSTLPASLKSGTQMGIDLSSCAQMFEFMVDGCYLTRFDRAWNGGSSSRSPVFGTNNMRYNNIAIYNEGDHPLFSGVNDIRSNYIGLGGNIWFDCDITGQKLNYNHYAIKCTRIERTTITNNWFFKNKKIAVVANGPELSINDSNRFVADDVKDATFTTALQIVTATISDADSFEVGDIVCHTNVTGLSVDIDEGLYAITAVTPTTYAFDVGTTITGTGAGITVPNYCHALITSGTVSFSRNYIRNSSITLGGGFGSRASRTAADVIIDSVSEASGVIGSQVKENRAFCVVSTANTHPSLIRLVGSTTRAPRDSDLSGNHCTEYAKVLSNPDDIRIDDCILGGGVWKASFASCRANNSVFECRSTTFGNVWKSGNFRLGSATPTGQYIFDIDAPRSLVAGLKVRVSATWAGGVNIIAVDGDTVPNGLTTGIDQASAKVDNIITSF